jgi:hypothetical protein
MAGVVIPIEGDASGLDAAIDRASASIRQLGAVAGSVSSGGIRQLEGATAAVGRSTKTATASVERYTEAAYALNKAAQVTGGALSFITGPLDDLGDLLERGGGRMAALSVAAVGVVGGMYAVGRAAVAAGQALYDTAANASALIAELEAGGRTILPAHRDALLEAEQATIGLSQASTSLQLTLAGTFAGTLTDTLDTVSGLTAGVQAVITTMGEWSSEIDATLDSLFPMYRAISLLVGGMGELLSVTGEAGKAAREQATAAAETAAANTAWMKAIELQFAAEDKAAVATKERTAAIRDQTKAKKEAVGLTLSADDLGVDGVILATDTLSAYSDQLSGVQVQTEFFNLYFAEAFGQTQAELSGGLAKSRQEWDAYFDGLQARAQQWADNSRYYASIVFNTATNLSDALTKNERKAARNRAIIQKAAAITEATINTLVGVTKALASSAPPINFVLAALVGAAGAVNIGLIAAKPLVYHRGGMLDPDEERLDRTAAVVRRNESIGIVTSSGRSATTAAVSRLNAGEVSAGDTYLMVEGDVLRTRRVGGPAPGYGRKQGVRGGR